MEPEKNTANIIKAFESFRWFNRNIFPLSFKKYIHGDHLDEWASIYETNPNVAILSGRKHSKSTTNYSYLMWRIFRTTYENEEWKYLSYKESLASWHLGNVRMLVRENPWFNEIIDNKIKAETIINYSWDGEHTFKCSGEGILAFNRGWHGYGVICDDILADPADKLDLTVINKINDLFFKAVLSMPIEGGEIKLVGTAQDKRDLFFRIKEKSPNFYWGMYPAEENSADNIPLWPEMFSWERLKEIEEELTPKFYRQEYLCSPVRSEEAYFTLEDLNPVIDNGLVNYKFNEPLPCAYERDKNGKYVLDKDENPIEIPVWTVGGMDIGKKRHPSYVCLFRIKDGIMIQTHSKFMDQWDYKDQIFYLSELAQNHNVRALYYDDTRAEFEGFREQGQLPRIMYPLNLAPSKTRFPMAAEFGKRVKTGKIRILNDSRMIDQILCVDNDLKAPETHLGHGDSFFGIAMACEMAKRFTAGETKILDLPRYF